MKAYCTSYKCYGTGSRSRGTLKENVPPKTVNCPDCGSVLLWTKYKRRDAYRDKPKDDYGINI